MFRRHGNLQDLVIQLQETLKKADLKPHKHKNTKYLLITVPIAQYISNFNYKEKAF